MSIEIGSTVEGKVTGITKFGAFVELPSGDTGLVHISEVANTYVKDISNFLKPDDTVKVKVIKIGDDGKIGLSIRRLEETAEPVKQVSKASFEDQLNRFLRESNERLQDLRNREAKRGGGSHK
ncbi:MAG: S1 RNA-binding domain-containing protein [Halanaerobiaceae bacterium]|nr:S1 RNA-binding domain-containing protein [Halanaerobiaceae bacterium]